MLSTAKAALAGAHVDLASALVDGASSELLRVTMGAAMPPAQQLALLVAKLLVHLQEVRVHARPRVEARVGRSSWCCWWPSCSCTFKRCASMRALGLGYVGLRTTRGSLCAFAPGRWPALQMLSGPQRGAAAVRRRLLHASPDVWPSLTLMTVPAVHGRGV